MLFLHGLMRPRHDRQTWTASPAARALDRARCIVPRAAWSVGRGACLVARGPWPLVRDPWAGGRAWCALVPGPWAAIRAPWCATWWPSCPPGAPGGVRPGARSPARAPWWPPAVARAPGGQAARPRVPGRRWPDPRPRPRAQKTGRVACCAGFCPISHSRWCPKQFSCFRKTGPLLKKLDLALQFFVEQIQFVP